MNEVKNAIEQVWNERVYQKFVYRGMDENDLKFPLNTFENPHTEQIELIINFLDLLDKLLKTGLQFEVIEKHFGKEYKHDPANLSKWTRRDINRNAIDFTSNYQSAKEYSDCWQGSQLKQNLKSISNHLLMHNNSISTSLDINNDDWECVNAVNSWINAERFPKPIVLYLRRDNDFFHKSNELLPLGTKRSFKNVIFDQFADRNKISYELLCSKLPIDETEFYCSIDKPLQETDVYKIERQ